MSDRLQEAKDLIAAMNGPKPWTFGDTEKALSLLEWAVGEVEQLRFEASGSELYRCNKCGFVSYVQSCCFQCRALKAEAEAERLREEMRLARRLSEAVDAYEEEEDEATCFALYDAIPTANEAFMRAHYGYGGTGRPRTQDRG